VVFISVECEKNRERDEILSNALPFNEEWVLEEEEAESQS